MKKIACIFIALLLMITLSGCHEQERADLQAVIDQEVFAEDVYTPETYRAYEAALAAANAAKKQKITSSQKLQSAKEDLQEKIDALELKPDKSALFASLKKFGALEEEQYTTVSYNAVQRAVLDGADVAEDENATQLQVDEAVADIDRCLENLTKATKGVYLVKTDLDNISNNSVGNEWTKSVTCNGKWMSAEEEVVAALNSSITITVQVTENDKIPDTGQGSVKLTLKNGSSVSKIITVRENRGRYAGNVAKWELTCTATLIERI